MYTYLPKGVNGSLDKAFEKIIYQDMLPNEVVFKKVKLRKIIK